MVEKYRLLFYDKGKIIWRVKFLVDSYSSPVVTLQGSGTPLVFEFQNGSDDIFDPLRPSQVQIQLTSTTNFKFTDLFDPDIMSCKVEIYQDSPESDDVSDSLLYWQGWVDPSQYEEPYDVAPYYLTITCVDGLSYLSNIKYAEEDSLGGTEYYSGRRLASQVLLDILGKISYTEFIEYLDWYETTMAHTTSDSPMDQEYLDADLFREMMCDEVLELVVKKFNAIIRQWDGVFHIYRPVRQTESLVYGRYFTGAETKTDVELSPIQYINRTATHPTYLRQIPGGVVMQQNPAKKVNIIQNYGYKDSWISNYNLHKDTYDEDSGVFQDWTTTGGTYAIPIGTMVPGEQEGVMINNSGSSIKFYQSFGNYVQATEEDEVYTLEFEYGIYSVDEIVLNDVYVLFSLKQGGKYAFQDETDSFEFKWRIYITQISPPKLDKIAYGWNGWNSYSAQIRGLQSSDNFTIYLYRGTSDTYACFKNIRFYASSTYLSNKIFERRYWQELNANRRELFGKPINKRWPVGRLFAGVAMGTKKPINNVLDEKIVEYTYNPECDVIHGEVLDYNYSIGDVRYISVPASEADTHIINILDQFAGSIAINSVETLFAAAGRFAADHGSDFGSVVLSVDTDLSELDSDADNVYLFFESSVIGTDFSGATSIANVTGTLNGVVSTLVANSAGTLEYTELIGWTGSSGYARITIAYTARIMYYDTDIATTISNFVAYYGDTYPHCTLSVGSDGDEIIVEQSEASGDLDIVIEDFGLDGIVNVVIPASAGTARKDVIRLTGGSGTANITCNGYTELINITVTISNSGEWMPSSDESSDLAPFKPLLELAGDEIAEQYSRVKQLIQMPIIETGTNPSTLNIIGSFIDDVNTIDLSGEIPRRFVVNRGTFDVRHRKWELDLVEVLISETEELPEYATSLVGSSAGVATVSATLSTIVEALYGSTAGVATVSGTLQDKIAEITINHIDTIVDGVVGLAMVVTFEYESDGDDTQDVVWYMSSDAAGEFAVTVEEMDSVDFSSGVHTAELTGITYPNTSAQYLWIKIFGGSYVRSNQFDSISISLNHIDTIATQYVGEPFEPTFNATASGTITATLYWRIRNSSHVVVDSGTASFDFTAANEEYAFDSDSGILTPNDVGTNHDFQISKSPTTGYITSNHFSIEV